MAKLNIDKLLELKQLYEQGILTKEEMEAEKAKILNASASSDESTIKETPSVDTSESSNSIDKGNSHNKKVIWGAAAVIAVVIVVAIVVLYLNKQEEPAQISSDDIGLVSEDEKNNDDEEAIFIECVKNWDEMHNNKGFDDSKNSPYAETVYFFETKMSGIEASKAKQKAVMANLDYRQESKNIKVTKISDKLVVCDFEKHTCSNNKSKVHPGSYLFLVDEGGIWKIKEESDFESDSNLQKKREQKSAKEDGKVAQPITLQLTREICDLLKLPYHYWDYVRNEIEERDLNVTYKGGKQSNIAPYELRSHIAMKYKYKNGNAVLDGFTHYYNYLGFCEAIGRIKDVWNVVPVRIENNDEYESPLFQFRYEGNGLDDIIITAQHVEGEETYKFIREDNQKEISLDLISY